MKKVTNYPKLNIKQCNLPKGKPVRSINWQGQTIKLDQTAQPLGGVRYWFKCPKCQARRSDLYQVWNRVACRVCHHLYGDQQDNISRRDIRFKLMDMLNKLTLQQIKLNPECFEFVEYKKISDPTSLLCYLPDKPKYMHWNTYARKAKEIEALQTQLIKGYKVYRIDRDKRDKIMQQQWAEAIEYQRKHPMI